MLRIVLTILFFQEYCADETFSPECEDGKIILMHSALYGRMELGRCVLTDLGFLGCQTNVLPALDGKCSGQRFCEMVVNDREIQPVGGCNQGLKSYLDVEYTCVDGIYFSFFIHIF